MFFCILVSCLHDDVRREKLFVNHSKEFKLVFVYLNIGLGQLSKSV